MFFSLTGIGIDNSFDATRERQLESARQTDEEKMNQMIAEIIALSSHNEKITLTWEWWNYTVLHAVVCRSIDARNNYVFMVAYVLVCWWNVVDCSVVLTVGCVCVCCQYTIYNHNSDIWLHIVLISIARLVCEIQKISNSNSFDVFNSITHICFCFQTLAYLCSWIILNAQKMPSFDMNARPETFVALIHCIIYDTLFQTFGSSTSLTW